jgi:hypothetical protein
VADIRNISLLFRPEICTKILYTHKDLSKDKVGKANGKFNFSIIQWTQNCTYREKVFLSRVPADLKIVLKIHTYRQKLI